MKNQYRTIVGIAHAKHVVKKSRFFGEATSVHSLAEVKVFLAQVQKRRPHASHYCYAYSIAKGMYPLLCRGKYHQAEAVREYATDAGEPTHSAGPSIPKGVNPCKAGANTNPQFGPSNCVIPYVL